MVTELAEATADLTADTDTRAVLVRSALDGVFMAGADITEFQRVTTEGIDRALLAQEVFTRFAELPQPTVAAINGHALGGGLELALACDFRFAARVDGALIGLPEVRLGLLPGAGGTQRLTHLVGAGRATELIMKGLQLSPEQARARTGSSTSSSSPTSSSRRPATTPSGSPARRRSRCAGSSGRSVPRCRSRGLAVEGEAFREVLASKDAQAGVTAFLNGERATFSGE